jgi:hypothetical protein
VYPLLFAFINFHRQETQPAIPEVPQGLDAGTESVRARSIELIGQYSKGLDAIIKKLNADKDAKTKKQIVLEEELASVDIIYFFSLIAHSICANRKTSNSSCQVLSLPYSHTLSEADPAKRAALEKEIAQVKKDLEDIQIALKSAEDNKKKYSVPIYAISDTTKKIGDALVKGPQVLKAVLTDVFQSVRIFCFSLVQCFDIVLYDRCTRMLVKSSNCSRMAPRLIKLAAVSSALISRC